MSVVTPELDLGTTVDEQEQAIRVGAVVAVSYHYEHSDPSHLNYNCWGQVERLPDTDSPYYSVRCFDRFSNQDIIHRVTSESRKETVPTHSQTPDGKWVIGERVVNTLTTTLRLAFQDTSY